MSLTPGTRIGTYEVVGLLGAGGMGEVYRARDTTLGRDVALKVLSPVFSNDEARVARFSREARTLASLKRPRRLFAGAYTGTGQDSSFDVSADGKRFAMVKSDEASTRRRVSVVQNWMGAIADERRTKN